MSPVQVAKPHLGENHPAQVRADVTVNLSVTPEVKREWIWTDVELVGHRSVSRKDILDVIDFKVGEVFSLDRKAWKALELLELIEG